MPVAERERLLAGASTSVIVARPDGLLFVGGLANSYEASSPTDINIDAILTEPELERLVEHFNNAIQSFWPCTACYAFGCLGAPFTLGLSLLVPNYCISEAEKAGLRCLEQFCLKPAFFTRGIKFALVKTWGCSSHIEMTFPVELLESYNPTQEENGGDTGAVHRGVGAVVTAPVGALAGPGASREKAS
jgi:hypothetical protein